ncbi:hypothetical protein AB2475_16025 [Salmonella enterica]
MQQLVQPRQPDHLRNFLRIGVWIANQYVFPQGAAEQIIVLKDWHD